DDRVVFSSPAGSKILDFTYSEDWHPTTAGDGFSLVIVDPNGNASQWNQPQGWRPSNIIGGTPGTAEGATDVTPPSAPQGLSAGVVNGTQVSLQWQAATDAESPIIRYQIYRDGALLDSVQGTSFVDDSTLGNSFYTYRVTAVNAFALESAASNQAAVSISPVGNDPAFADGKKVGDVTEIELQEISGIIASRKNHDVLWVHEDGPQTSVVAINTSGRLLGTLTLTGVQTVDWEDIAIGPGPVAGVDYLYIADIGDNL